MVRWGRRSCVSGVGDLGRGVGMGMREGGHGVSGDALLSFRFIKAGRDGGYIY